MGESGAGREGDRGSIEQDLCRCSSSAPCPAIAQRIAGGRAQRQPLMTRTPHKHARAHAYRTLHAARCTLHAARCRARGRRQREGCRLSHHAETPIGRFWYDLWPLELEYARISSLITRPSSCAMVRLKVAPMAGGAGNTEGQRVVPLTS
jgi:hypothetical protein